MIDPVSLSIAGAAGALAVAIAWHQWPRAPELDGQRWFMVALATLLRGKVEGEGGDEPAWEAAVRRWVWYHPLGRLPERKISNPRAMELPGLALPGERALLEALAEREGADARWAWLFDEDETGLEARLQDPIVLGSAYDPASTLGRGATWDTLADWGSGKAVFGEALREASELTWVLHEGRSARLGGPSLLEAVATALGEDRVVRVAFDEHDDENQAIDALETRLEALAVGRRLVLWGEEAGVARLLRVMARHIEVRDAVFAIVSTGGVIGGRTDEEGPFSKVKCEDWMGQWFDQRHLDTELNRLTPYFSLQWLDRAHWPPGVPGQPLQLARFPEPKREGALTVPVEAVDLGVLPASAELPVDLVAKALVTVVEGWVVRRRVTAG